MIASLPMYDWPEIREKTDLFWLNLSDHLHAQGIDAPAQLNRNNVGEQWHSTDLFLSQTCIYPLATELSSELLVLGTPTYNADYCKEGLYASPILVHKNQTAESLDEMKNTRLAFNSTCSQSGFNALRNHLIDKALIDSANPIFFSHGINTGSHRDSIKAIADGRADICAIDPVSWALAKQYDTQAVSQVKELTQTAYSPALPLICHPSSIPKQIQPQQWREMIQAAFQHAIEQSAATELLLNGIKHIDKSEYTSLQVMNLDMYTIKAR